MATHSSVLAWRIPGTGEPGGLPSMGSHRVGHDWSDLAAATAGLMQSFRFSTLTVFSSVNRLFYFFLSTLECLAFHFLALLYLLKPPVQCWAKVVGVDILVLFLILGRKYLFFKIKYDTSCSFSIDVLTRLRILISILVFWEFFKWEWILDYFLPNAFSTFFEMIRFFFHF